MADPSAPGKSAFLESVTVEMRDRICILTLNNPDSLNAMGEDMADAFDGAIQQLRCDKQVKVLIVTGKGRAFSAGGDLDMIKDNAAVDPGILQQQSFDFYNSFLGIRKLNIPVIAAVNGIAVGAGACLALACHMRIVSEAATFGFPFARLGLHPGMGAEYFLQQLVGEAKTFELLLTGDFVPAEEALRIGLVNQVVPEEELMDRAQVLAGKICALPDLPIKMMVDSIPAARYSTLEDTLQRQAACQAINYKTPDFQEGVDAVIEKRRPKYTGRY
ncbi:MAG TPA: hypothetical protein DHV36_24445 [Desulfobacteraceae bacterium]|nr:hypothetical protein [Desulfobacteraceae bacterium]